MEFDVKERDRILRTHTYMLRIERLLTNSGINNFR